MSLYTAAITLFLVLDPIGNIPIFLSVLGDLDSKRRRRIIVRETVIALLILAVFLFFGKYILRGMNISPPAVSIGGGIVLFLIALRMIFPASKREYPSKEEGTVEEPLIVPLAVPLLAGPSAMATLILFANQEPSRLWTWFLALVLAWLAASLVLLGADFLRKRLGRRALAALERLMGMILITMATEMLLTGIRSFVAEAVSLA
ncbi:MAG: MarC family protein [Spirochaetaceae bacterium]